MGDDLPARPDEARRRGRLRHLGVVADTWAADAEAVPPQGLTTDDAERYRGRRRLTERGSPSFRALFLVGLLVTLGALVALPFLLLVSHSDGGPGAAGADPTWDAPTGPATPGDILAGTPGTPSAPTATPTPTPTGPGSVTYQAESSANTLTGSARVATYEGASGGAVVRNIGVWPGNRDEGTLRFTAVTAPTAGTYSVRIYYALVDKGSTATVVVRVGSAAPMTLQLSGGRTCCAYRTITVTLAEGRSPILFSNPTGHAPAIDRIVVTEAA